MDKSGSGPFERFDDLLCNGAIRQALDAAAARVERRLAAEPPDVVMAWEPVPLDLYGVRLPADIRSSWVFILRAGTATGAERHPNSRQTMISFRGDGDLQTRAGLTDEWQSHPLVSEPGLAPERRWISVPENVWHQAVVATANWIVVSFHTAAQDELIEERPDPADPVLLRRQRYSTG